MLLDHQERNGAAWQKLRAHIEQRLEVYRRRNDGPLSEVERAKIRGRIAELKLLLSDVEPSEIQLSGARNEGE